MGLDDLHLSRFRNHRDTRLAGTGKLNLLTGENGAGKTNVLEALSLLSPGRGMRQAEVRDFTLQTQSGDGGAGGFAVGATLLPRTGGSVRLGTFSLPEQPGRRQTRINGAAASTAKLGEWLALSWLTPAMDRLFTDAPAGRRQFLDRLVVALSPGHAGHAARYAAATRERNRLLAGERPPEASWLDGLEAQMARHGSALAGGRLTLVDALSDALRGWEAGPLPRPALAYVANAPSDEEGLAAALRHGRVRDLAAGRSLLGPHRDDLSVTLAAKGIPAAQTSTGEQKALLVALILAHVELVSRHRPAVLLLDEIAAHLDPTRREALFERLHGGPAQVWLTGTEPAPFAAILRQTAHWRVEHGEARKL